LNDSEYPHEFSFEKCSKSVMENKRGSMDSRRQ